MANRLFAAAMVAALVAGGLPARAQEPESCAAPRFSDVGWTDISATTAVAGLILEQLGYMPKVDILSVAVTYEALPRGDIDIFLGNWMPLQVPTQKPLVDAGKIEVVRANLEGAIIGFAVPKATYDAGLKTYSDIAGFADDLDHKIYGIEAGSSANATISEMIESDKFGLADFSLVELSEQAMLAQVQRAARGGDPIVFFGWRPHPMNVNIEMAYLTDGDNVFGPNDGAATVLTNTRPGYVEDCPNVGKFLQNLAFSVEAEDLMMSYILDDGMSANEAAEKWLKDNPQVLDAWLDGVTTRDGQPGLAAVRQGLGL
jgi:glycine betaine/proline transport system substrate-binding protein